MLPQQREYFCLVERFVGCFIQSIEQLRVLLADVVLGFLHEQAAIDQVLESGVVEHLKMLGGLAFIRGRTVAICRFQLLKCAMISDRHDDVMISDDLFTDSRDRGAGLLEVDPASRVSGVFRFGSRAFGAGRVSQRGEHDLIVAARRAGLSGRSFAAVTTLGLAGPGAGSRGGSTATAGPARAGSARAAESPGALGSAAAPSDEGPAEGGGAASSSSGIAAGEAAALWG